MHRVLFLAAAATLVGLSAAKATEYEFSFSGAGVTASGDFTVAGTTGAITSISGSSAGTEINPSTISGSSAVYSYTSSNTFNVVLSYNTSGSGNAFTWNLYDGSGTVLETTSKGAYITNGPATGIIDPVAAPLPAPGVGVFSFSFLAAAGLWSRIKAFAGSALGGKRPRAVRA
jgi:hypothetical protein